MEKILLLCVWPFLLGINAATDHTIESFGRYSS